MKIALYIEDGLEQIVLTPETEMEKSIVGKLSDDTRTLSVYQGGFYSCNGGWVRHLELGVETDPDTSTILVLRKKK